MEKVNPSLDPAPHATPAPLTLEAICEEKIFEAESLRSPHWMQDGQRFSYLDKAPGSEVTTVWLYDIRSGKRTVVVPAKTLALPEGDRPKPTPLPVGADPDEEEAGGGKAGTLNITGTHWSPDETQILFAKNPHPHAARPGDEALYVVTLATQELKRVTHCDQPQRNAKWSPDGKNIGYVRGDDLYVLELATGKEMRLTDTAAPLVYNGRFGWVYEEELDLVDGWAWSPDGRRIAYFQQDETPVPLVNLPNYDDLHMAPIETRYPKAGDPNPLVKIGLVDVPPALPDAGTPVPKTRWVDLGADPDIYIARLQWTPQGDLLLQRIPRLQNRLELLKADPVTGKTVVLLTEEDKAWVDAHGDLTFLPGTNEFLWWSDRSGHRHLYLYDLSGKLVRQLTEGNWDLDEVCGIDATHRMAYFTAARPTPMERHLFSILLDGGGGLVALSDAPGTHQPLFAPDGQHYLNTHSSRAIAPHVKLYQASGQHVANIHDNPMPKLRGQALGQWEFQTFATGDGVTLNAALLRPADFDPKRKYPVLIYTYGGPSFQVVRDTWGNGGGLEQFLAQKGYLFAMVDGRGSGMRGRDFLKITYQNLGKWEVADQIEGARWLAKQPYVDPKRIGIWGWSYGGTLASLCILRGADLFKAAIAVAPVTHWALYDSIYTERYMRRPKDNPKGYADSSPLTIAGKLKGNFLLVHGTADDNVHFQNSARLAAAFQNLGRPFRLMVYPGKHHGLEGVSLHLYAMLTDFLVCNL